MEKAWKELKRWLSKPAIVLSLLGLSLLPLLYANCFNHPSNDDFDNAVWSNYGAMQAKLYTAWTGRYFSSLLVTLTPLHWHSWTGYRLAAAIIILAFSVTLLIACVQLLRAASGTSKQGQMIIAVAGVMLFFNNTASLEEGFYWFTGAMTYTLAAMLLIGFLLLCMRLNRYGRNPANLPFWAFPVSALLLLSVIGSNETLIPAPFLICVALGIYYRRCGAHRLMRLYLWLLPVCAAGAAIALLAPGNALRQQQLPRSLAIAMPSWLYFSKELFLSWISDPFFLLYSSLVLLLARRMPVRIRVPLWVAFLSPLLLICVLTLPGFYALGRMPPYRVQNIVYLFFLLSWIFCLLQFADRMQMLWDNKWPLASTLRQVLGALVIVCLLATFKLEDVRRSSNYFLLAKSIVKGQLRAYNAEMEARYHIIRQAQGDTVMLPPITQRRGNLLYFADLSPYPDVFPNLTYAQFWGKRKVWIDTSRKDAE